MRQGYKNRFSAVPSSILYSYYSSGDEVLETNSIAPALLTGAGGLFNLFPTVERYAWAFQEKRKGSATYAGGDSYTFSHSSGWRFNSENEPDGWSLLVTQDPDFYAFATPAQASSLSSNLAQLVTRPFFGMGSGEYRVSLFTTNAATANAWLSNATNEWRVLAGAVPARSLAAGKDIIPDLIAGNVDMNQFFDYESGVGIKEVNWPDRGGDNWLRKNWLHSDIRNMAYLYTYRVFDVIASKGGLK